MVDRILDSSVLLAIFNKERFRNDPSTILDGAVMSTVNLAEVLTKLQEFGVADDPSVSALVNLLSRVEPFTQSQAQSASGLRPLTRNAGLSLGDRACLALALELNAEVYTADRAWAGVNVGCTIHLIR